MDIVIDPEARLADIELRSDETVVLMGSQPVRISKELNWHLYKVVSALVWANGNVKGS